MITPLLLAALLLAEAPLAECPRTDARCQADALEARATTATSPALATKLLRAALRLRLSIVEQTPTATIEELCAARATAARGLEFAETSEARVDLETQAIALAARARELGGSCAPETEAEAEAQTVAPEPEPEPEPRRSTPAPVDDGPPTPPRRRPLLIAGSVSLGAGVSLVGAAGYAIVRTITSLREGNALVDDQHGPADATTLARDAELREEFRSMGNLALGAGIAGGVAVIVGAAFIGVSRPRTSPRGRAAVLPTPAGLVISGRF